jgi:hypothetical protein
MGHKGWGESLGLWGSRLRVAVATETDVLQLLLRGTKMEVMQLCLVTRDSHCLPKP